MITDKEELYPSLGTEASLPRASRAARNTWCTRAHSDQARPP